MNIGSVIKNLRLKRDVSQKELVRSLRITQGYLSLIESGDREPSFELIDKIAAALKIPPQLIFLLSCDNKSKNTKTFAKPLKQIATAIDDILSAATI